MFAYMHACMHTYIHKHMYVHLETYMIYQFPVLLYLQNLHISGNFINLEFLKLQKYKNSGNIIIPEIQKYEHHVCLYTINMSFCLSVYEDRQIDRQKCMRLCICVWGGDDGWGST